MNSNRPEINKHNDNVLLYMLKQNNHGNDPCFIRKCSIKKVYNRFHRHDCFQINYMYKGRGRYYINNSEYEITKGDILIIPPYVPHYIKDLNVYLGELYELEFLPELINQFFRKNEVGSKKTLFDYSYIEPFIDKKSVAKPVISTTGEVQAEIESVFNEILHEFTGKNTGYLLVVKSLILKLLAIIKREKDIQHTYNTFDRHKKSINNALEYINCHYYDNLNVEHVAKISHFSSSYFSYLFKAVTSKTFTEYVNSLRISKAMEFLLNTEKKISEICFDVGFNNTNHFNRIFKHYTGVTPCIYRKFKSKIS